jgi:uncharacterized OB-fold protein
VLPIPQITEENEAFWTGGRGGRLMITRCADCGNYSHPPAPRCGVCHGNHVGPEPVSGKGEVYSFTINRQRWTPDLEVPYVIAIVELTEQRGLRLFTNVIDCPVDEVEIGMPVEVDFLERSPAFLPVFRRRPT